MAKDFRQRLLEGDRLIGTIVTLDSPEIVEILCRAGFDWLFIDAEHSPLDSSSLQRLLQAAGSVPCLIRIPTGDEPSIKKALDVGATGIIVPQVNSAEQARQIVSYSKYPPQGSRGVGISRAHGYGFDFQQYIDGANDQTTIVVQAEHVDAVENICAIATVDGIDAIFVGPYDLSASLGKLGELSDPTVLSAIDQITEAGVEAGTRLGIFGLSADDIEPYSQRGYSLLVSGVDSLFLGNSARSLLDALRNL